jgi:ketosteroid isomerase-like protein
MEMKMHRLPMTLSALCLATFPVGQAKAETATDRQALEQLASANDTAWGAKDVAAMASQYVANGSVRVSPGAPVIAGRGPVSDFFKQAFDRRQGVHRHITKLDHIDWITPDMALADASVRVERQEPDGGWSLVRTFRNITLSVREDNRWKLRSVRAIPQD